MTLYLGVEYVTINCGPSDRGGCGLQFAMTRTFYDEMQRTGKTWYCPKGHPRVCGGKTTEQQLRDAKSRNLALKDQLSASIREGELTRQALLRDRQRFLFGVCVCCNRSFENVRRHMASQHPDFDAVKISISKKFQCSCGDSFTTLKGLRIHQGHMRGDDWDKPNQDAYWAHLTRV